MGELKYIAFEDEAEDIKDKVESYWKKRAASFFELRHEELESNKAALWTGELEVLLENRRNLRILDLGCGAGFFEIILGNMGHEVIGVDLTKDMVDKANEMIKLYGMDNTKVKAVQGDAENPGFPEESFDVVISRNLTWTLPHPIDAYKNWYKLLKKDGMLLNFDAEYAKGEHNLYASENKAHMDLPVEMKDECHDIYHMLTISTLNRPAWDVEILKTIGVSKLFTDEEFGSRIFAEHDRFYIPDKMFCIKAKK
ncbi:MAG: class I SAM-dependent methyltransferase [Lachnospiraceae bacterium]|nr:class I SAM-dependent methyltransferase [Lachnospiraceae bacterium]